jgi:hypothetical protein
MLSALLLTVDVLQADCCCCLMHASPEFVVSAEMHYY